MCVNILPKKSKNLLVTTFKILQLLGDFVPQAPNGAPPLEPAGGLPSPRLPVVLPPISNLFRPPEAEAFSLNYMIIWTFFDHEKV